MRGLLKMVFALAVAAIAGLGIGRFAAEIMPRDEPSRAGSCDETSATELERTLYFVGAEGELETGENVTEAPEWAVWVVEVAAKRGNGSGYMVAVVNIPLGDGYGELVIPIGFADGFYVTLSTPPQPSDTQF